MVVAEGHRDRAALFLVEYLRARRGEPRAQCGFAAALAEGIGRGKHDRPRPHRLEKLFRGEKIPGMASEHEDIGAQRIAVSAQQRRFGLRSGVGHEQNAERTAVDPRHKALVVRGPARLFGRRMEKSDGRCAAQVGHVAGKNQPLRFPFVAEHLVKLASRRGAVAQDRVNDRGRQENFRHLERAAGVFGIPVGQDKRIELSHAFGAQGGFDHAEEIAGGSRVEEPRVAAGRE